MNNLIDKVLKNGKNLKLMTHVVAGYPDIETNKKVIKIMAERGVDLIEIQIPFSDPMADGPTIMRANQKSLDKSIKINDCFDLVKEIKSEIDIPLLFMSYANVPFTIGIEKFILKSVDVGISGLIIPDLPFDEDNDNYYEIALKNNIHPISVISPDIKYERLKEISEVFSGFIYTTLKVGTTGAKKNICHDAIEFLKKLKNTVSVPIAAGFGISSTEHLKELENKIDIAIIGSHLIDVFDKSGIDGVSEFLEKVR
jgi:tryptophan synthase alpha chain